MNVKNRIITTLLFVFCCVLLMPSVSEAQYRQNYKHKKTATKYKNHRISRFKSTMRYPKKWQWTMGSVLLGSSHYFGDLAPRTAFYSTDLKLTRTFMSAFYTRRFGPRFLMKGELFWVRLQGDDQSNDVTSGDISTRYRYYRGLHFRNDMFGIQVKAVYELYETNYDYDSRPLFNPYVFGGIELFTNFPKAKAPDPFDPYGNGTSFGNQWEKGEWVNLRKLKTEGQSYSWIQPGIPAGIGCIFAIGDRTNVGIEFTYHWVFTDYLDDVSTNYVPIEAHSSDLARVMSNRSAEIRYARTDELRQLKELKKETRTVEGKRYTYLQGFKEGAGNPRGNKANDHFVTSGFYFSYIIFKRSRNINPKFRR